MERHPIQYERIESNAEHLEDDDVALQHHDDDDENIAVQFMTPWGPMTMEDEPNDGDRQTGAPAMGSGWEFEYNFDIDNFPFHLLPTLAAMNEEEMTDGDGNVTGNYDNRHHQLHGRSGRKKRDQEKKKRRTHQRQQSS